MNLLMVFAKAPVPGRVKTRLCPPLTPRRAALLHAALLEDTLAGPARVEGARLEVAYEPAEGFPDLSWLGEGAPAHFRQEGPDLGARLCAAFGRAFSRGAARAAAIGSDAPHLPSAVVAEAFRLLESNDAVLGPAEDGGYYLVGLSRPCPGLFSGIPWSGPEVLECTRQRAGEAGLSLALLPRGYDLDTAAELSRLEAELRAGRLSLPATARALGLEKNLSRS